jgi:bifunctional non-homologous end joining protein LigD
MITRTLPDLISPMLATPGPVPTGPGWAYEFKWDGVRAVTYVEDSAVRVLSRNDRDVTASYPELAEAARLLAHHTAVLDGEIVALDADGRPSFAQLQRRMHVTGPPAALLTAVPVAYHVFDVLHLDGEATLDLPYARRRELLAGLGLTGDVVRTPEEPAGADAAGVMAAAGRRGLEGVVAKRLASPYRPGRRSADWVKTPFHRTQEVVVVGWKQGEGRRAGTIGSLVLAVTEDDGSLSFAGGVGTGFTAAMLGDLQRQLAPWARRTAPVPDVPREHARGVQWVEPVLVGEVAYRTFTPDGRLRHASWRGLRPDRGVQDARRPATAPVAAPAAAATVDGSMATADGRWRVDIMRRGTARWYRLRRGDAEFDWLDLPAVERILTEAGVDLGGLVPAGPDVPHRDVPA